MCYKYATKLSSVYLKRNIVAFGMACDVYLHNIKFSNDYEESVYWVSPGFYWI